MFYVVTLATILSALILPVVGAAADRSSRQQAVWPASRGPARPAAAGMFLVAGTDWQLGAVLLIVANMCLGSSWSSTTRSCARSPRRTSATGCPRRGWAFGYLGGGLLLAVNLVVVARHDAFGLGKARRCGSACSARPLWWAGFTVIPYLGLRDRRAGRRRTPSPAGWSRASFGQLATTLREMRGYPMTLTFLVAYLFFNDGIQTVIVTSSTYGEKELGFETSVLIATILMVQFVAFGGALLFGAAANRTAPRRRS